MTMSSSSDESARPNSNNAVAASHNKYKGIRRRKWGKWVSEIRVPGTPHRLWLGSYATPEAAAVAHDVACYCLRGDSSMQKLNFPLILPASARIGLSPRAVQKAASDAGLAVDARLLNSKKAENLEADGIEMKSLVEEENTWQHNDNWRSGGSSDWLCNHDEQEYLNISVEDYL